MWIAALIGVVGVILIEQPHVGEGRLASLAALGASLFTALAMIGLNRLKAIDTWAIVVHFSLVSLLFSGGSLFLFERRFTLGTGWEGTTLAMLVCVGLSATVGQFFLTKAFTSGSAAKVSLVGLTQVGFGVAFDALWWGRSFGPLTVLGTILVVASTAWLLGRTSELQD